MIELPFYYLIAFLVFLFGAIIGSFLNVLILRFGTGMSSSGRSRCFSCNSTLTAIDLVPIGSFIFLNGRCRMCHSRISFQYPLVELLTALSFLGIFLTLYPHLEIIPLFIALKVFFAFFVASLLIVISVYDIRHKIIPNPYVYLFIGSGFAALIYRLFFFYNIEYSTIFLLDALSGPLLFGFFYLLWALSKGRWMGYGDAKLVLGIGLHFGFINGISAVMFGFWVGAIVGLLFMLPKVLPSLRLKGSGLAVTMHSEIPFAPFLILGMAIVFFFNLNVFQIFS